MKAAFVTLGASTFTSRTNLLPTVSPTCRPAKSPIRPRCLRAQTTDAQTPSSTPAPESSATPESSTSKPASKEFLHRFDNLRGKAVEPVAATVARFNAAFTRPVPIVYRSIINEMLTTSHLAMVCAMWRFDALFAYGFDCVFTQFLRYYPKDDERDMLYKCCADALRLDLDLLKSTSASVQEWLDGKTEDDVFAALNAAPPGADVESVGPVIEALAYIRDSGDFDWYYSRLFGIGLIQVMQAVGTELTMDNAEKWADAISMEKSKFAAEMGTYLSSVERLKQAEQIFAEAAAREAKKTAERLSQKAEAAVKEAEALEKAEEEASSPVVEAKGEVSDESSVSA